MDLIYMRIETTITFLLESLSSGIWIMQCSFLNKDWIISETGILKLTLMHMYSNWVVKKRGLSQSSKDGIFRLVSCSNVVKIKRFDLLPDALKHLDFSIHWTHLGDGPMFDQLQQNINTLPRHIKTYLPGRISPEEVFEYYQSNPVDLFVNVSESEGMPVSIMEALSAGIPVMATDVGGTAEVLDNNCGKLIHKNIQPDELAKEIEDFAKLPPSEVKQLRHNAVINYENNFNFDVLIEKFITFLKI